MLEILGRIRSYCDSINEQDKTSNLELLYESSSELYTEASEYFSDKSCSELNYSLNDKFKSIVKDLSGFSCFSISNVLNNLTENQIKELFQNKEFFELVVSKTETAGNLKYIIEFIPNYVLLSFLKRIDKNSLYGFLDASKYPAQTLQDIKCKLTDLKSIKELLKYLNSDDENNNPLYIRNLLNTSKGYKLYSYSKDVLDKHVNIISDKSLDKILEVFLDRFLNNEKFVLKGISNANDLMCALSELPANKQKAFIDSVMHYNDKDFLYDKIKSIYQVEGVLNSLHFKSDKFYFLKQLDQQATKSDYVKRLFRLNNLEHKISNDSSNSYPKPGSNSNCNSRIKPIINCSKNIEVILQYVTNNKRVVRVNTSSSCKKITRLLSMRLLGGSHNILTSNPNVTCNVREYARPKH